MLTVRYLSKGDHSNVCFWPVSACCHRPKTDPMQPFVKSRPYSNGLSVSPNKSIVYLPINVEIITSRPHESPSPLRHPPGFRANIAASRLSGCADRDLVSTNQFDLARPPGFSEERLLWTVESKNREPPFSWVGLNPIAALDPFWLGRTEVDSSDAIGVRFCGR